jgi:hypothetical protein
VAVYRKFIMRKFIICAALRILLGRLNGREEMGRTCSTYETNVYRIFVRRNRWSMSFGWPILRWRDNVKMDLGQV